MDDSKLIEIADITLQTLSTEFDATKEAKFKEAIATILQRYAKEGRALENKKLATDVHEFLNKTEEFIGNENTAWHVLVGEHFVCTMKHEPKYIIFLDIPYFHKTVLAFKSG